jgi:hypothetical protein
MCFEIAKTLFFKNAYKNPQNELVIPKMDFNKIGRISKTCPHIKIDHWKGTFMGYVWTGKTRWDSDGWINITLHYKKSV